MKQTTIFLLLFLVFSFLYRIDLSFDQDLGRHIKLGEIIIKTHQVPKTNLFSYTNPGFPFINTHWLFEVIAYGFNQTLGLQAFLIVKVLVFLLSVWLMLKIVPKENRVLMLPIGFIFLHVLRERLELRPEIFSFLFTALSYYILEKNLRKTTKLIYILPAVQLIWINTHIYFFVGLILQAIYLLGKRTKLLIAIFISSVIASLINPNFLTGFLYPLNVSQNYGYTIVENQTMFLLESINFKDPNFIFVKLCWGIIALSLVIALIRKNFNIKNILITIFGLALSLLNVRSFPYLIFLSLPAILQSFGPIKQNTLTKILIIFISGILIFESFSYLNGEYYRSKDDQYQTGLKIGESGKKALDFVLQNNLPNSIFNNFDIGSYIIYRGYPKYKVFVDGRPESYPAQFFTNTYIPAQYDYAKFKLLEKEIGFRTIIFSHTDQTPWGINFLQSVVKDTNWKLVFIDDFMVVFIKEDTVLQKDIKVIDLANLDPSEYKFENHVSYMRLGLFLLRTQNTTSGKKFIEKAYQIYPKSPVATSLLTL